MSHDRVKKAIQQFYWLIPFLVLTEDKLFSSAGYAAKVHKIKILRSLKKTNLRKGHTYTNPPPDQYLTNAHSHITRAVAAMGSCLALIKVQLLGDMAVLRA